MRVATYLGDADFYLLVFPLLYWSVSRRIGLRVGIMLLVSAGLNFVLKLGSTSPRPMFLDPRVGLVEETTFGIPSGHAQNAVAVWGALAVELGRRWTWAVAVTLMLVIGISRVHLGAHFPIDTVLGWSVGLVLLAAYVRWRVPVRDWVRRSSDPAVVAVGFGCSLALVAAGAVARELRGGWAVPTAWVGVEQAGIEAELTGLSSVVTPAAALFGLTVGVVLLARAGGFDESGPAWQRTLRYPVGLIGVLVLWRGLGAVLPGGEDAIALVARYVRYTLVGLWITGGAPLLFRRLGLARAADERGQPADVEDA